VENHGNQGGKDLRPSILSAKPRGLLPALWGTAALALVFAVLSFFLPALSSARYYDKSLDLLRANARKIKAAFSEVTSSLEQRRRALDGASFPKDDKQVWSRLRDIRIDKSIEGLSYYGPDGRLKAWFGSVLDLEGLFLDKAGAFPPAGRTDFILKEKASAYLLSIQAAAGGGRLALFRLLAHTPQFKSPYLEDYQFISPGLRPDCDIDYWDFREDVSGFEKTFSRHQDEYIGQPRMKDDVQSLIFPLRSGSGHILATVSLGAPLRQAYAAAGRQTWLLASGLSLLVGLALLLIFLATRIFPSDRVRPGLITAFILAALALRLVASGLSRLDAVRSWPAFSPASAAFFSFSFLTRSPADIFASGLTVLLVLLVLTYAGRRLWLGRSRNLPAGLAAGAGAAAALISLALSSYLQKFLWTLVANSNLNILRLSFSVSLFLLLLSIFGAILGFFLLAWLLLRAAVILRPEKAAVWTGLAAGLVVFVCLAPRTSPAALALIAGPVLVAGIAAFVPSSLHRVPTLLAGLALTSLWLCVSLNVNTIKRDRNLLEHSLKNTIQTQELWAGFFLEEASAELDAQEPALIAFFKNPDDTNPARSFWERTVLAKFNWYSSLEILDSEATVLSRFSLNLPKIFQPSASPSPSAVWSLSRTIVSSMGQDKEFLVAVKDWHEGEVRLGRTVLSVSLDFEMLPFLYSANPYFELLRARSLPSLQPVDFRFAVFDTQGRIVFNPDKVTAGLSPELLNRVQASPGGIWSKWADTKIRCLGLFFISGKRAYALLLPVKTPLTVAVEFLKLFFIALAVLGLPALLAAALFPKRSLRRYFWSFSNRVYLALVAVAILPLLLFTFSTRSFFSRIFSQQFTDEAEIHADFARNVMEDYFFLQQDERRTPQAPPEDLVLWISSTIGNDVNLYQDGRLAFSSRAELFDSGLLPELIDGEVFYNLVVVRNPLVTQRRTLGDYSFHTLTIPYARSDSIFLISLPFPFEQAVVSSAMAELLEFLLFLFAFVLGLIALLARNMRTMIVAPIHKLLDATREAGRGNLDIHLEHKPNDEMKTLVDGFNAMIRNLKQHQADLAEMSQKAAWAEMARKVAHEIKNPLTPIQLSAEHLLRVYTDRPGDFAQALKESTAYIINEVENLRKIAQEFLESSREAPLRREPVDIQEVVAEILAPYKKMLSDRIALRETYTDSLSVCLGDKSKLKMAVRNIFINAVESIPGRGEIALAVSRTEEGLRLEVRDTGQGMDKEVLARIFEPSFSTKATGAGLGLPIAKKIIEDHGGSLRIDSRPGRGTRVVIILPAGEG
jgi:signal transduction histidine kinase